MVSELQLRGNNNNKMKYGIRQSHFLCEHALSLRSKVRPAWYTMDPSSWEAFFVSLQSFTGIALLFCCITAYKHHPDIDGTTVPPDTHCIMAN